MLTKLKTIGDEEECMRRELSASYVAEKAGYKTVDTLAG
jgi:hypothetical protein